MYFIKYAKTQDKNTEPKELKYKINKRKKYVLKNIPYIKKAV